MHSLAEATIAITAEDGRRNTIDVVAGATFWSPEATHAVENVGEGPVHRVGAEERQKRQLPSALGAVWTCCRRARSATVTA